MRRFLLLVVLGSVSVTMTGCGGCGGGGVSQASMRAHALRNADVEATPKKRTAPKAASAEKKPEPAKPAVKSEPKNDAATTTIADAPPTPATVERPVASPTPDAAPAPVHPLTEPQRRKKSIDNLTAIGTALSRYVQVKGLLPYAASFDPPETTALLSWRVELLPYLGYMRLHQQFHLDEPWDSAHNIALVEQIPPIYQSPGRADGKTNYLMPVEGAAPFTVKRKGRQPSVGRFEDGIANTLVILEVSDEHAVPWTKPQEFDIVENDITELFGRTRSDGLFVVWGDGRVSVLPNGLSFEDIKPMLTKDALDSSPIVASVRASLPPIDPPDAAVAAATTNTDVPVGAEMTSIVDPAVSTAPPPVTPGADTPTIGAAPPVVIDPVADSGPRADVPDATALSRAQALFNDIYRPRLESARSRQQKSFVAKQLLAELPRLEEDPAGQYVLLGEVRRVAVDGGDAVTAVKSVEELAKRFHVDGTSLRINVISEFGREGAIQDGEANEIVLTYAVGLVRQAYAEDNFPAAQQMYEIAITAARRTHNQPLIRTLQYTKQEMDVAKAAYAEVESVLKGLGANPDDSTANLVVGRYYCFVKNNWAKGLPLLSRGDDEQLRALAEVELDPPALAEHQIELADRWWALGEEQPLPHRRSMQLRGVGWYQKALAQLSEGLQKVKVEVRLKEAQRTYGRAAATVSSSSAAAAGPRGVRRP